jgi:hypothetical protein
MADEATGRAISQRERADKLTWTPIHQTDADDERGQGEQLRNANALAEDDNRQDDGENRRQAAERAGNIRAHETVGFEIQQRCDSGEEQSDTGKQDDGV